MFNRIAIFIFILLCMGCSHSGEWQYFPESPSDEINIYVVSHGWHTGIVIPGNLLGEELGFLNGYFDDSPYYEIGWGDKGFYQAKAVTAKIAIKALFWPTQSVMHVVSVPVSPELYFPQSDVLKIKLSRQGFNYLKQAVTASFKQEKEQVIKIGSGLYGRSWFFEAEGEFHLSNTCNTWTARILEVAGLPVATFLTVTSGGVMRQISNLTYECCEHLEVHTE